MLTLLGKTKQLFKVWKRNTREFQLLHIFANILMGIWWYLTVIFISIPLRSNDMEHLFRYIFIYCEVSKFFVHFLLYCMFSFYCVVVLCIFLWFIHFVFSLKKKKTNIVLPMFSSISFIILVFIIIAIFGMK